MRLISVNYDYIYAPNVPIITYILLYTYSVGVLIRSKHLSTFVQVQHLLIVGISHGRENTKASLQGGIRLLSMFKEKNSFL